MQNGKKIRVLHMTQAAGGVEAYIRNVCRFMDRSRFEIVVISSPELSGFTDRAGSQIPRYIVPFKRVIHPFSDLVTFIKIWMLQREIKPDLIHVHSAKAGLIGRLTAWLSHTPSLYTPHAFSFLSGESPLKRAVYLTIERLATPFTCKVLACSRSELSIAVRQVRVPVSKTILWQNCIDPGIVLFGTQGEGAPYHDAPFFLTCARPSYQKNLEYLIDVVAEARKRGSRLQCLITGVGHYSPLKVKIENKIKAMGLESTVRLIKWLEQDDNYRVMAEAMFYISTSRYEGLPLSVIEAAALGKPAIVSDVPGNRDCVWDKVTGFIVPDASVGQMAEKILCLEQDETLRQRMGKNARVCVETQFNIRKRVRELERIYLEAVNG